MKIAVDFDGTIVEHRFPKIGKVKLFAFETLLELQKEGHDIILWTFRSGKSLKEALEFCRNHGLVFYSINSSYKGEKINDLVSRKINADIFIDDRNIGGFPGWDVVWKILSKESKLDPLNSDNCWKYEIKKKKRFYFF